MAEKVETKKKRKRKVPSVAILKITVERIATVWNKTRDWKRMHDDSARDGQYAYVDAELPQTEKVIILEQSLPEAKFDLAKVIKAINGL